MEQTFKEDVYGGMALKGFW